MTDRVVSRLAGDAELATALDLALERHGRATAWRDNGARTELQELMSVAFAVESSAAACAPSQQFRAAGRARVLAAIAVDAAASRPRQAPRAHSPALGRESRLRLPTPPWLARAFLGLAALSAAGVATASAAGTALPGEALYPLKQAGEALVLELPASDGARAERLVEQADTRLDEVVRLSQAGRSAEAAEAATHYEQAIDRATSALGGPGSAEQLDVRREQHHARLEAVLAAAPSSASAGLERALAVARRGPSRPGAVPPGPPERLPVGSVDERAAEVGPGATGGVEQHGRAFDDTRPRNVGLGPVKAAVEPEPADPESQSVKDAPPVHSSAADKTTTAPPSDPASPGVRQPERAGQAGKPPPPGQRAEPPPPGQRSEPSAPGQRSEPSRKPTSPPGRR